MEGNFKIDPSKTIKHNDQEYTFKQLVDFYLKLCHSFNHKIYRKVIKKVQRKFDRQANASLIEQFQLKYDRIKPRELDEQSQIDDEKEQVKLKEHHLWLERERLAQIEWKAKTERATRLMEEKKTRQKIHDKRSTEKAHLQKQNNNTYQHNKQNQLIPINENEKTNLEVLPYHNPFLDLDQIELMREPCTYFLKTGVCKYGNMCNKSHILDYTSLNQPMTTLIFPAMYKYMLRGYEIIKLSNSDEILEYDEDDLKENFKLFYDEVLSEFRKHGKVVQFLVCSNYQAHLRGNVYVQYDRQESATDAYTNLNGCYFRNKKIFCFYTHVKNWRDAVCGQFLRNKCQKGQKCNYMHILQNPYDEFPIITIESVKNQESKKRSSVSRNSREPSLTTLTTTAHKENYSESLRSSRSNSSIKHKSIDSITSRESPQRKKHKNF